jgi:hypothetical protein
MTTIFPLITSSIKTLGGRTRHIENGHRPASPLSPPSAVPRLDNIADLGTDPAFTFLPRGTIEVNLGAWDKLNRI